MKVPKEACIHCHFLTKTGRDDDGKVYPLGIQENERIQILDGNISSFSRKFISIECFKNVWAEGYQVSTEEQIMKSILEINRKEFCFFFPHHQNMLMQAADDLQKREYNLKESHKDRRQTNIGLYIAGGALFVNIIIEIIKFFV